MTDQPAARSSSVTSVRSRLRAAATRLARGAAWSLLVPLLRLRASRRIQRLRPGAVTVVTVNWNAREQVDVLIRLVRKRSRPPVRILVVDNHSRDGSRALLRRARAADMALVSLPFNAGHDLALDIGFLLADTEYVVALDVDAFPIHDRWLDELLAPLGQGAEISGARLNRAYVHPCCLAMRTERFVRRGHSFRARYRGRDRGPDASGDVGEIMSAREAGRLRFFDVTSQRGPGDIGSVFGGLVYHNFYTTRFRATTRTTLDREVGRADPARAWEEALARYDA